VTKRVIDAQSEPVILVGHSYGGAVITEAGTIPRWRRSSTSRPSCRTRASR
jgi:pimeloyl-ACP methyl ester carboxylesterase